MGWREQLDRIEKWRREADCCQAMCVDGLGRCSRGTDMWWLVTVGPTELAVRVLLCAWHKRALENRGAELVRDLRA